MTDGQNPSLQGARVKVGRAEKHLEELQAVVRGFLTAAPPPFEVRREDNTSTGMSESRLVRADPIPAEVAAIAGDVIHNLRSALDHAVGQLVWLNGHEPTPETGFPIWGSEESFRRRKTDDRRIQGISADARNIIVGLKPFNGGNQALWQLHRLDVIDKHRLLLTLGEAATGQTVALTFGPIGILEPFKRHAPTSVPVGEVLREVPIGDPSRTQFRFGVVIEEDGVIGPELISIVMGRLKAGVEDALTQLESTLD